MIPIISSIDRLLNRFDELAKSHENLLSSFARSFPNLKNPLRDVTRTDVEQKQTTERILLLKNKTQDENCNPPINTLDDFHRHIIKVCYFNRPPNYYYNEHSSTHHATLKKSSVITESNSVSELSADKSKTTSCRLPVLTARKEWSQEKHRLGTNKRQKLKQTNKSVLPKKLHSKPKAFTVETMIRLSKPKSYCHIIDSNAASKFTNEKSVNNVKIKKPAFPNLKLPPIELLSDKRRQRKPTKTLSSTQNTENPNSTEISKRPLAKQPDHLCVKFVPTPIINIAFPWQIQQQQPSYSTYFPNIFRKSKFFSRYSQT